MIFETHYTCWEFSEAHIICVNLLLGNGMWKINKGSHNLWDDDIFHVVWIMIIMEKPKKLCVKNWWGEGWR